jgi:hypothetical protein
MTQPAQSSSPLLGLETPIEKVDRPRRRTVGVVWEREMIAFGKRAPGVRTTPTSAPPLRGRIARHKQRQRIQPFGLPLTVYFFDPRRNVGKRRVQKDVAEPPGTEPIGHRPFPANARGNGGVPIPCRIEIPLHAVECDQPGFPNGCGSTAIISGPTRLSDMSKRIHSRLKMSRAGVSTPSQR